MRSGSLIVGLALGATVALAALHGLDPALPRLAIAAPAWLAGILLWPNANRRTRQQVLVLLALGLIAMAAGLTRGGSVNTQLALAGNALLIAMLAAVSFLRLITHAEAGDRRPPSGRRSIWSTLLGVHLFGAVINLSVVFIMADRLNVGGRLQPRQVQVLTRGFSAAAFWSPFFAAMAAAITYSPGASLGTLLVLGAPLAALALTVTSLGTSRAEAERFTGYPMRYTTLWLPALLALLVITLHQGSPDWPVLTIICLLAPSIAILVSLWQTHGRPTALIRHLRFGLPGMTNELLLFLAAGIMAAGIDALFGTLDGWLPFRHFHGIEAVLTLATMVAAAVAGVHPVIAIAVLGSLLAPLQPEPSLLAMTFLSAWAIGVACSPFSGMNLALQGRYQIPALGFLRWNGGYSLTMLGAASLVLIGFDRYVSNT